MRLDGGFVTPALFDSLEAERVRYVVAMAKNTVLQRHVEPALEYGRAESAGTGRSGGSHPRCWRI